MKIVRNKDELKEQITTAASEAQRYFGDSRVYAERLVELPRHIEVQVLGDGEGNVVHLFERECSLQRRYQKIVEESPAPNLPKALRDRICDAAVELAKAAKYKNAGTVEFILGADGEFYFLEMNTRLQVEHPITEEVVGVDLVEAQLKVAAGEGIPFKQSDLKQTGWSIECRINAEEPEKDFRPAIGRIGKLNVPTGEGVRFDAGIVEGQAVTPAFDSMLAKLITYGATREEAAKRMEKALNDLVMLGVPNNIDYLARIMRNAEFLAGKLHTGFPAAGGRDADRAGADGGGADRRGSGRRLRRCGFPPHRLRHSRTARLHRLMAELRQSMTRSFSDPQIVIPAKAGIHSSAGAGLTMDSRFRGNDGVGFAAAQASGI